MRTWLQSTIKDADTPKGDGDADGCLPSEMVAAGTMLRDWDSAHHPGGNRRWVTAADILSARDPQRAPQSRALAHRACSSGRHSSLSLVSVRNFPAGSRHSLLDYVADFACSDHLQEFHDEPQVLAAGGVDCRVPRNLRVDPVGSRRGRHGRVVSDRERRAR